MQPYKKHLPIFKDMAPLVMHPKSHAGDPTKQGSDKQHDPLRPLLWFERDWAARQFKHARNRKKDDMQSNSSDEKLRLIYLRKIKQGLQGAPEEETQDKTSSIQAQIMKAPSSTQEGRASQDLADSSLNSCLARSSSTTTTGTKTILTDPACGHPLPLR